MRRASAIVKQKNNILFLDAVKSNNIELCKRLLNSSDVDVNYQDEEGKTSLFWAVDSNNEDLVILLVEAGADPNTSVNEETAIDELVNRANVYIKPGKDEKTFYCGRKIDPNTDGFCGPSSGIQCNDCKGLAKGLPQNRCGWLMVNDNNHYSCGHTLPSEDFPVASEINNQAVGLLSFENNRDGNNLNDELNVSDISVAIESQNNIDLKCAGFKQCIHCYGYSKTNIPIRDNRSSFYHACYKGYSSIVDILLAANADVELKTSDGLTPLIIATTHELSHIVKSLITVGNADVNRYDSTGLFPLFIASKLGNKEIVSTLLSNGAKVDLCNTNACTSLNIASKNGHLEIVNMLLSHHADFNLSDKEGDSPLINAIKGAHKDIIQVILDKGFDINTPNKNSKIPLAFAFDIEDSNKSEEIIGLLIDNKSALVNLNDDKESILHLLIRNKYTNLFDKCLNNINIDTVDSQKNTPLHKACSDEEFEMVKYIISKKANINALNIENETPLFIAIENDYEDIVNYILELNSSIENVRNDEGYGLLHIAMDNEGDFEYDDDDDIDMDDDDDDDSESDSDESKSSSEDDGNNDDSNDINDGSSEDDGDDRDEEDGSTNENSSDDASKSKEDATNKDLNLTKSSAGQNDKVIESKKNVKIFNLVQRLLPYCKQNIDSKNAVGGNTPLHYAIWLKSLNLVKLLCDNGADVNTKNGVDIQPIHSACRRNLIDIVKYLLAKKVNINSLGGTDLNSPLHFAVSNGYVELTELLLSSGADINIQDSDGYTALHFAAMKNIKTVEILLKHSISNIDVVTNNGDTPLTLAASQNSYDIVDLLISKGANITHINNKNQNLFLFSCQYNKIEIIESILKIDSNIKNVNDALIEASKNGQKDIVKILLSLSNINVNVQDDEFFTPLLRATNGNHSDVLLLLLQAKAFQNILNSDEQGPIHVATVNGKIEIVRLLIEYGVDTKLELNCKDRFGQTVLHIAAKNNFTDILKLFIESGCDINIENNLGETPLYLACENGFIDSTYALIENGANLDAKNSKGFSALSRSTWKGHINIVKALLDKGADVNTNDADGDSPLTLAAMFKFPDIFKLLLSYPNIDVNHQNNKGFTPIYYACQKGLSEIVQLLLENNAKIDSIRDSYGNNCLHVASLNGNADTVKYLLDCNKLDILSINNRGFNALHKSVENNEYFVSKLLIKYGIDINCVNVLGKTPLSLAIEKNNMKIVQLLIDTKKIENYNILDNQGNSYIHAAVTTGSYKIVQLLVEKGVDVNKVNRFGLSPLLIAVDLGYKQTTRTLLESGASANYYIPKIESSPLMLACRKGHIEIVKLLLRFNALVDHLDCLKRSALHYAVFANQHAIVKLLLNDSTVNKQITSTDSFNKNILDYSLSEDMIKLLKLNSKQKTIKSPNVFINSHTNIDDNFGVLNPMINSSTYFERRCSAVNNNNKETNVSAINNSNGTIRAYTFPYQRYVRFLDKKPIFVSTRIVSVCVNSSFDLILVAGRDGCQLHNYKTGKVDFFSLPRYQEANCAAFIKYLNSSLFHFAVAQKNDIEIYNSSGYNVATFDNPHKGSVISLSSFSSPSLIFPLLICGSNDSYVVIWNVDTNEIVTKLYTEKYNEVNAVHFCQISDNKYVAIAGGSNCKLYTWDIDYKRHILQADIVNSDNVPVSRGSGSSSHLYYCSRYLEDQDEEDFTQCGPSSGYQCKSCKLLNSVFEELNGHKKEINVVTSFQIKSNKSLHNFILSGCNDGKIILWGIERKILLKTLTGGHSSGITSLSFFSVKDNDWMSARALSGGKDKTCILWNLQSGEQLRRFEGQHQSPVNSVCLLEISDNNFSIVSSDDDSVAIWDTSSKQHIQVNQNLSTVTNQNIGFSADIIEFADSNDYFVVFSEGDSIIAKNLLTNQIFNEIHLKSTKIKQIKILTEPTKSFKGFIRVLVLAMDYSLSLWDFKKAIKVKSFSHDDKTEKTVVVTAISDIYDYSTSRAYVLACYSNGTIQSWLTSTGKANIKLKNGDKTSPVTFILRVMIDYNYSNVSKIVSGYQDGSAIIWDFTKSSSIKVFSHSSAVSTIALTSKNIRNSKYSESLLLVACNDFKIYIWGFESFQSFGCLINGHQDIISNISISYRFNKNSSQIDNFVASSSVDSTITFWNILDQTIVYKEEIDNTTSLKSFAMILPDNAVSPLVILGYDNKIEVTDTTYLLNICPPKPRLLSEFQHDLSNKESKIGTWTNISLNSSKYGKLFWFTYMNELFHQAIKEKRSDFLIKFNYQFQYCLPYILPITSNVSILAYTIQTETKDFTTMKIILNAWSQILSNELYSKDEMITSHPMLNLSKYDLILLSKEYPSEFLEFIKSIKLMKVSNNSTGPNNNGNFSIVIESLEGYEIFGSNIDSIKSVWDRFFTEGNHFLSLNNFNYLRVLSKLWLSMKISDDSTDRANVTPLILPLQNVADIDMIEAYVNVSKALNNVDIFESDVGIYALGFTWQYVGKPIHTHIMLQYIVFLFLYSLAIFSFDRYVNGYDRSIHWTVWSLQALSILFLLRFLFEEIKQIFNSNESIFEHIFGDPWNSIDVCVVSLGLTGFILRFSYLRETVLSSCVLAAASVFVWFKILYFLRPFRSSGPLVSMILHIANDIRFFLLVLASVLLGFSQAFWLLSYENVSLEFGTVQSSLFSSFLLLFGQINSDFTGTSSPSFSTLILVLFLLFMTILMLNLLIALMGQSFSKVADKILANWRFEQASVILEQNFLISTSILKNIPPVIHILKYSADIDNNSIDDNKTDTNIKHGSEDTSTANEINRLKDTIKSLEFKLDKLVELVSDNSKVSRLE